MVDAKFRMLFMQRWESCGKDNRKLPDYLQGLNAYYDGKGELDCFSFDLL